MKPSQLGAAEAAAAMRRGDLSPLEMLTSTLDHLHATEPALQAWTVVDEEGAHHTARALEGRARHGPLHGVPIGVKDVLHVRGLPTVAGFAPWRDFKAAADAAVVHALRAAGAVVLGKTVCTQFAVGSDPPRTRNPWDHRRTPGGSSSGSAAAVGGWQVPLALGTQTGGSLLRPAAYCGAVALKPTYGRLSRAGVVPVSWSLDHVGVVARSVADVALALSVLSPRSPDERLRRPVATGASLSRASLRPPRLGLIRDLLDRADPPVRRATEQAAQRLADAGATVEECRLGVPFELLLALATTIRTVELAAVHASQAQSLPKAYEARVLASVQVGQLIPAWVYAHAQRLREQTRPLLAGTWHEVDALLAPTGPDVAPLHADGLGRADFQAIWSVHGVPNLTLPAGLADDSLPLAVQLVMPSGADWRLLDVAAWAETVLGQLPPPPLPA